MRKIVFSAICLSVAVFAFAGNLTSEKESVKQSNAFFTYCCTVSDGHYEQTACNDDMDKACDKAKEQLKKFKKAEEEQGVKH